MGGWVSKSQKHDDVILEWSLTGIVRSEICRAIKVGNLIFQNPEKV